ETGTLCRETGSLHDSLHRHRSTADLKRHDGPAVAVPLLDMVGLTLENSLRPTDFIGRWGENEFLVILTECTAGRGGYSVGTVSPPDRRDGSGMVGRSAQGQRHVRRG